MAERRSNSREAMVKFLKERIASNQGISLKQLTGHLSQLPSDLRTKYGSSVKSLKVFLQQFPKVFAIRSESNVYVLTKCRKATLNGTAERFMASTADSGTDAEDVTSLTDVRGTVYRIFRAYGFISIRYPIKTSVYFDLKAFEDAEHASLLSSGLQVGDCVVLDAKVGPKDCKARFRASRVARAAMSELSSSPCNSPHVVNDGAGGDCSTVAPLFNQHGVIEAIKYKHGFIKFGRSHRERAFFHANNVDKSLGKSFKNLTDVFAVEDKVRFNAKPSKKPSDKVKWEATTVYLCRSSDRDATGASEDEGGNEVFMSDEESDVQDFLQAKLDVYESNEADFDESLVSCADLDASSVKAGPCSSSVQENRNSWRWLSEWERRQKLTGERGCFYPVTESVGTIKFGPSRGLAARAAVEVTYREKKLVDNLLWEVAQGQEVSFDAIQSEDTWIATLVWIGQRPAKPLVGDSEDVLNGMRQMSPEEPGQRMQADTLDVENSLYFEDFETEMERAASRRPSRVLSDKELPEDMVRSRRSGASSPGSVAGLLAARPAGTSPPNYMRSPGAHNESSAYESVPEVSFLGASVNDEVLLRLARMVAAEIIAEKREGLRVDLHDVAVQTIDEEPCPSPSPRPDGLVLPGLVSASTQTLSTGRIMSEELFIS